MTYDIPAIRFIEVGELAPQPVAKPTEFTWQRVVQFLRSRELSVNTRKAYTRQLQMFYDWTKQKPWHEITHNDIDQYKQHLKQLSGRRGGGMSPATINQALAALKSFFKWLVVKDYISRNPTLTVELLKEPARLPRDLTDGQLGKLADAVYHRGDSVVRDLAIFHVLSHGLRASEVCGLDVSDYDGRRLHVRDAKWGSDGQVPLKPKSISIIDGYLGWLVRNEFPTAPQAPLFISLSSNSRGRRLGYGGVYNLVKDIAAASDLEDIHPHRFRHTFATALVADGMNPMLAKRATRIRSDKVFARYGERALGFKMEEAFEDLYGEPESQKRSPDS